MQRLLTQVLLPQSIIVHSLLFDVTCLNLHVHVYGVPYQ